MRNLTIKEWAVDDRPREKLLAQGEQSLSDAELLAVLLRTGCRGHSALDMARQMIECYGSLRKLAVVEIAQLRGIKGLGPAKIAQIKAALELGKRIHEEQIREIRPKITTAKDVVNLLMPRMRDLKIEVFKVVYLNAQNHLIAIEDMAEGTVNQANPIIREILHKALKNYAVSMICVHNHPSGNSLPSKEDKEFTQRLKEACQAVGVKFLDHIIVAEGNYYSIAMSSVHRDTLV